MFDSAIQQVVQILSSEFEAIDIGAHNDDHRPISIFHGVFRLNAARRLLFEYAELSQFAFEVQIITELSEAAETLEHLQQYGVSNIPRNPAINPKPTLHPINVLRDSIDAFHDLLEKPNVHEKHDIHRFLNANRFLLHPTPAEIWSEAPIGIGTKYRLDFLIRDSEGRYLLIELENPQHTLFTKSGDFAAIVGHAQRQVEDWQQWIEDNLPSVQKVYPDISSPEGVIIVGRSGALSPEQQTRLRRRNINTRGRLNILTYDDLLQRSERLTSMLTRLLS
jgi:hypothetical protein